MVKGDKYEVFFQVNQNVYNGFINTFNDKNPLHTNDAFAKEKGFNGKVMHGNILTGFISYFVGEGLPLKNIIIHSEEIKFRKPVYYNDKLKLTAEITDFFESVNIFEISFFFENAENVKVATGKIRIGVI